MLQIFSGPRFDARWARACAGLCVRIVWLIAPCRARFRLLGDTGSTRRGCKRTLRPVGESAGPSAFFDRGLANRPDRVTRGASYKRATVRAWMCLQAARRAVGHGCCRFRRCRRAISVYFDRCAFAEAVAWVLIVRLLRTACWFTPGCGCATAGACSPAALGWGIGA